MRANGRRKLNHLHAMKLDDENWCFDEEQIKVNATRFFTSLFEEEVQSRGSLNCSITYPPIEDVHKRICERKVEDEEIKEAIFSMGALKSPGPDGLNALFYQSQRSIVGSSVVKTIKNFFDDPEKIRNINETFIVLIPKKDHPETFRDLRPISLCNVIYKVITKIVANRMKGFMNSIVSPNQCSFVPGRHNSDNIIVAQEVMHSMRTIPGKRDIWQ